jgi:all-trans-retinol 13,14-reductase
MTASFARYDASVSQPRFDAIVIGSGMGGLGLAALLARYGRKVLVLERHYVAGGMTHTFRRQGFEWDVGLQYLGKVHDPEAPLRRAFDFVTGGALHWAKLDPVYDRFVFDDRHHDFPTGSAALEESLCRDFPSERKGISAYLRLIQQVERSAERYFLQRVLPAWLTPFTHPLLVRPFLKYSDRTTRDMLRTFTSNERLAGVLAGQWGNYALPPAQSSFAMHALVAANYLDGGSYPVGGPANIARSLASVIERAGGQVRVCAEVSEILVSQGQAIGVRMVNGDELRAPCIVSGTGVHHTLHSLLPESSRPRAAVEGLREVPPAMGHLSLYVGLQGTARELGLERTNLWIHADYDHDASMRAWLANSEARIPMLFVGSTSARDPEWESHHPGRSTLSLVCLAPYEWFKRWEGTTWRKRGPEYEDFKARLSERMLASLFQHLPHLRGKVAYQELSTPLSTRHFSNHTRGAIYGLEHSPARFRQRWLRPALPVRNLFLVGQDLVSVGVGASLLSAVLAASVILRRNVLGDVMRQPPPDAVLRAA